MYGKSSKKSRLAENLNFENFFLDPTMLGPIVVSGYEVMSSTFSVNSA